MAEMGKVAACGTTTTEHVYAALLLILAAGRRSRLASDLTRSGSNTRRSRRFRQTAFIGFAAAWWQIACKQSSYALRAEAGGRHSVFEREP